MGERVKTENQNAVFGFLPIYDPHETGLGLALFQTQYGWWDQLSPDLVAESMKGLVSFLRRRPFVRVHFAYQRGLDRRAFKAVPTEIRKRITLVERTRPPAPVRGFVSVEGSFPE